MEKEMSVKETSELALKEVEKLRQIHKKLILITPSESTKIQIEILYFDLLNLLRSCDCPTQFESTIEKLKQFHQTMYSGINHKKRTSRNSVTAIKAFRNSMRIILRELVPIEVER